MRAMQRPGNSACRVQLVACWHFPVLLCHARCKRGTWKRLDRLVCQRMGLQLVSQVDGSFLHSTAYLRNCLVHHCTGCSSACAILSMPSRASVELAGRCNAHRRSPALCKRLCTSAGLSMSSISCCSSRSDQKQILGAQCLLL